MRVLLLLAFVTALLLPTDSALGQAGHITLYADPLYMTCNITAEPAVGQFLFVYAVHQFASSQSSRWKLQNCCHTLTWFLDQPTGFTSGSNSQEGWEVSYGGCQGSPHLIATVWYQRLDPDPTMVCSWIWVVPDPSDPTGRVSGSDCNGDVTFPESRRLTFYDDGNCPCGVLISRQAAGGPHPCPCDPQPVETTTWGQVKALFE